MNEREASRYLDGEDVVPYAHGSVRYGKEIVATCLAADIPAARGRDASCPSGGCSPQVSLMVRREDAPRVAELLGRQWMELAKGEGALDPDLMVAPPAAPAEDADEPPCPRNRGHR